MTQEEIIEGNKLIAKFIGFYFRNESTCQPIHGWITGLSTMTYNPDFYLKFHSSWDWLMPVVEKINNMNASISINPANVSITTHVIGHILQDDSYHKYYFFKPSGDNYTPIEATWNAVVDFIKWYNGIREQNSKTSEKT